MAETLIGWISEEDADEYFETRLGSDAWSVTGADKTGALTTAYNQLSAHWTVEIASGEDPPDAAQEAQCEQALFLLNDPDIDLRQSLQAQNVKSSKPLGEVYAGGGGPVYAPQVPGLMTDYATGAANKVEWV